MERIQLIVEQLEECKRLILIDRVPQLRMALLLSDNATEILMRRAVEQEFIHSGMYEHLAKELEASPPTPDDDFVYDIYKSIISSDQKKKIEKSFNEKARFLSSARDLIDPGVAGVLLSIHQYRNAAYHAEKIRKTSIRALALVSFEIATDLLVTLPPSYTSQVVGEDYSWIERFGLSGHFGTSDLSVFREVLRKGLPLELEFLRGQLVRHLQLRLEGVVSCFDYLIDTISWCENKEDAFKLSQYNATLGPRQPASCENFTQFVPTYFLSDLSSWEKEVERLHLIESKPALFNEFAKLDRKFEPLELPVHEAVREINGSIVTAVDRARGK